jgi:hypothetical protein
LLLASQPSAILGHGFNLLAVKVKGKAELSRIRRDIGAKACDPSVKVALFGIEFRGNAAAEKTPHSANSGASHDKRRSHSHGRSTSNDNKRVEARNGLCGIENGETERSALCKEERARGRNASRKSFEPDKLSPKPEKVVPIHIGAASSPAGVEERKAKPEGSEAMTTGPSRSVQQAALQPALLFSIFDQFQHRNELCTGRLIGAIFGERAEETQTVTISQAFPIPHSEVNDQVSAVSAYA